jgi:hypothetical protein
MTPLEEAKKLQKKVQKGRREDPDISDRVLAKRHGIGLMKLGQLLTDEIPYPTSYKISAKCTGLPIEFVSEFKERGEHWCTHCKNTFPVEQFKDGGSGVSRHASAYCVKGKRK